MSKRKIG